MVSTPSSTADLAELVARFVAMARAAGLPVGTGGATRFAAAISVARPVTLDDLRYCAHATLALSHAHLAVLDQVFDAVFGGLTDPAEGHSSGGRDRVSFVDDSGPEAVPTVASEMERLQHTDFNELTEAELALLAMAMAELKLVTPMRRSRRMTNSVLGSRIDLRSTLVRARRTGGDPVSLIRQRHRERPRRLVMLCDISGSMEPYARALLQLVYCAGQATTSEVFTFATRLTRVTPAMAEQNPSRALAAVAALAPDWSSGTRIGDSVREFLDRHGRAGMGRGAVVMIVSDGWETGDPAALGVQMARLARVAHRIVWVNPRTQSPDYQPLVGGMAAAWPYCDAVVSAHKMDALDDLLRALAKH